MIEQILDKKEDIKLIINKLKNISFKELIKHSHYEYSLLEKNTDEKSIEETYPKFDLIKLIKKRVRPNNKVSYDFYYELNEETFVIIVLSFQTSPPTIINCFHAKRNFKKFKENLLKYYKKFSQD